MNLIRLLAVFSLLLIGATQALAAENIGDAPEAIIDQTLDRLRKGESLSLETLTQCGEAMDARRKELVRANHVDSNFSFAEPGRTDHYIMCVKLSIIYPERHGGWPFRAVLRYAAYPELKKRLTGNHATILDYAILFPAIELEDMRTAIASYERLKVEDPFLYKHATGLIIRYVPNLLWLVDHYRAEGMDDKASAAWNDLRKFSFPEGMERVEIADLVAAPEGGAQFVTDSPRMRQYGLKIGDIIAAVQGVRVTNMPQYVIARELDRDAQAMSVIVWSDDAYRELSVRLPGRLFLARMQDAPHRTPHEKNDIHKPVAVSSKPSISIGSSAAEVKMRYVPAPPADENREPRTWTSLSGKTVEAWLLAEKDEMVILKKTDGGKMKIPKSRLSGADRAYLSELRP